DLHSVKVVDHIAARRGRIGGRGPRRRRRGGRPGRLRGRGVARRGRPTWLRARGERERDDEAWKGTAHGADGNRCSPRTGDEFDPTPRTAAARPLPPAWTAAGGY